MQALPQNKERLDLIPPYSGVQNITTGFRLINPIGSFMFMTRGRPEVQDLERHSVFTLYGCIER